MSDPVPRVTWMIPVLNGMPYLPATLESIERQTFKDFQIAVWDNGSTDQTVDLLREWIPKRLPGNIVVGKPLPLGLARAALVAQFETEFAALVDADDVNHPERLAKQMDFLRDNPGISVVGTQLWRLSSSGDRQGAFSDYPLEHDKIVQEMLVSNPVGQPSVTFRRQAVLDAGNYRDLKVEDYELWLRMAARGFRFANLAERLVDYRVHEKSTTQKQVAADVLGGYMLAHVVSVASTLFGIDGNSMQQLQSRNHPHAAAVLQRIAQHLGNENEIWKSRVFARVARQLIAKTDVKSRVALAMKISGFSGVAGESAAMLMDLARGGRRWVRGEKADED